ncbi:MAG: hypothetical protein ACM34J_00650 [Ignavibacteria bacterium]
MNSNVLDRFNFNKVADFAREYARRESPKASRILDLIINKSKRDYLNFSFAYLRWIDDIVDNPLTPVYEKKKFIEYQKNLVSSLYKNENLDSAIIEEVCIFYFAEYAKSIDNFILLDEVKNMVEALSMDVYRLERSGVFSNEELDRYIELMSKSLFNILCNFTPSRHEYRREFYLGARFTTIALMIRDLEEDIDAGFINIGDEEIKSYKLDIKNLKEDRNFPIWLKDKINYILGLLYQEVALLKYMPLKLRLLTCYSLIYRLPWIIRAKVYGYTLKYTSGKTFIKELKAYFICFAISLNIFLKAFFYSKETKPHSNGKLSLKDAFKLSGRYTRQHAPKLWLITQLLHTNKKYVYLWFSYLKWVDDFVDNPSNDKNIKLEFIESQLRLFDDLSDGKNIALKTNEESFLYYCIQSALQIGNHGLINEGRESLESIALDAKRLFKNGIFSSDELYHYRDKVVRPIFNMSCKLLMPTAQIRKNEKYIGKFLWSVLIIRDFLEDFNSGYINISKEDIEKYNINTCNPNDEIGRVLWMKDKYPEYIKILYEEASIFKLMPLKIKLLWYPIYPFMIRELMRINIYDYNFGIKLKKNILKEVKIYLYSFSLSCKFLMKVL